MTGQRGGVSVVVFCVMAMFGASASAATLDDVRARGVLKCGVSTGDSPGFSIKDKKTGQWLGLDVDMCRAVAAAVLGDATKVEFVQTDGMSRLPMVQNGDVDLLSRTTTHTLRRDAAMGLNWAGINYYDGQGFLIPKKLGISSVKQLGGASVCLSVGTTTELNLESYFRKHAMVYTPINSSDMTESISQYESGLCDVMTADQSMLAGMLPSLKDPDAQMILPEVISKEPLGPAVRHGDDQWLDIVRWSFNAMLEAEEYGVTQGNVDRMVTSVAPEVRRLLGMEGDMGEYLGLDAKWAYRIVKQVGNYAESFERNVGAGSPSKLPRGLNALWKDGGIQYSAPVL